MRVALVVTGGVDRSGREAVIPALLWLVERLARRHDVRVYVLRYHEEPCTYALLGATVRDLGRPRGVWRQHATLVRALRDDGRPDVLHAYWALPAGLAAGAAGRRLGVPTVLTLDSGEFVSEPSAGYGLQRHARHRLAVAAAARLARRVTVCTQYQQGLARAHGVDALVIPLGVDRRVFGPGRPEDGPPWRLVHVANLNPVKDQTTLLQAFARVVAADPRVHLDIVGLDTLDGAMQRLAADLGLSGRVTFHGWLSTDAVAPLYQRAHLHVLSSRHEAAGVVTLEAAACAVPSVGSSVGYIADWAPESAVGVPAGRPELLADALVALLRDPARRAAMGAAARRRALDHDADWTATAFDALYADLARRPAR